MGGGLKIVFQSEIKQELIKYFISNPGVSNAEPPTLNETLLT